MKFKSKGTWKSIPMPHTMFGDGNESAMCGGIEILEDYSFKKKKVVSSPKEEIVDSKPNKVKSKAKKRKGGAENQVPTKKRKNVFEVQDVSENFHESEQKSKNKKNKKKSKNKPAINLEALSNIGKPKEEIDPVIKPSLPSTNKSKKVSKSKVLNTPTITEDKPKKQDRGKLHDMNAWREMFVCEEIISALEEKGFTAPTPIQKLTLPAALKGKKNILINILSYMLSIVGNIFLKSYQEPKTSRTMIEASKSGKNKMF